jgi:hypothetical protein
VLLNLDSAVLIATAYRLGDRGTGVRVQVASRIFSTPPGPDRLWDPLNFYPLSFEVKPAGV